MRLNPWLAAVATAALVLPAAHADFPRLGIFNRGKKPDPAQKVQELVQTLKTNTDEKKRASAADDLKEFDAKQHPDVLAVLLDTLQRDPSVAVRTEAASSLGKVRPISQQVGAALEQVEQSDPAPKVRAAAKASLSQYKLVGYRPGKADGGNQTAEPPIAQQRPTAPVVPQSPGAVRNTPPAPTVINGPMGPRPQTVEPPLAQPPAATGPSVPAVPVPPTAQPEGPKINPPSLPPAQLPKGEQPEGPKLNPPG